MAPARPIRTVGGMTESTPSVSTPVTARRAALDLPILAIVGLALLAVPRAVLHDLSAIQPETFVNLVLAVVPPLVWVLVVALRRRARPFLTVLAIGGCYGVFLALVHQLLWHVSFAGDLPRLGGNLGHLDPVAQDVILRTFAATSSVFTGLAVGAIAGLVAWGLSALLRRGPAAR